MKQEESHIAGRLLLQEEEKTRHAHKHANDA
jgi:hypothetical protein